MFRPLVRQPWGLEPDAVSGLSGLPNLKELIVTSGRLVGGSQASEVFVKNVLMLKNLQNIELQWQIESRLGTQLLQGLPNLKSIQFIHISSPDVWLGLPSFYRSLVDPLVKNATLG